MSRGVPGLFCAVDRTVARVCADPRGEDMRRPPGGLKAWRREVERQQLAAWFRLNGPRVDPQHAAESRLAASVPVSAGDRTACLGRSAAVAAARDAIAPEAARDVQQPAGDTRDAGVLRSSTTARSGAALAPPTAPATAAASVVGPVVDGCRGPVTVPLRACGGADDHRCSDSADAPIASTTPWRVPVEGAQPPRPVRLHLDRGDQGDRCFIGHDAGYRALALQAADEVRAWARRQGRSLAGVVINGAPCETARGAPSGGPAFPARCGRR